MGSLLFVAICVSLLIGFSITLVHSHEDHGSEISGSARGNDSFYLPQNVFENISKALDNVGNSTDIGLNSTLVDLVRSNDDLNNSLSNITTTESHHEDETDVPADLTVTDAAGCFTALKDQYEEQCFEKFETIILNIEIENESERRKKVCCGLEGYEKCCLNGYKRANCDVDRKNMKETLKAARVFLGAVTNISCSEHRGMCGSAPAIYISSLLMASCFTILLLL